jgi:hypothetical protein
VRASPAVRCTATVGAGEATPADGADAAVAEHATAPASTAEAITAAVDLVRERTPATVSTSGLLRVKRTFRTDGRPVGGSTPVG